MMGCLCRKKKNKQIKEVEIPVVTECGGAAAVSGEDRSLVFFGNIEKMFDLEDMMVATAEFLGKGTFGTSYKTCMEIGPVVMKSLTDVRIPEKKLVEMLDRIGKINHENLLPLKAYHCSSRNEKVLVYDYMPMGSLSSLLHSNRGSGKGKAPLKWDTRFGIVLGVARAIAHLHSLGREMIHGNIKSSNVLLTTTLEARVSDYLLNSIAEASLGKPDAGYCDLEENNKGEVSQEADVYSFGVLLLELLTGKTPFFQDDFTLKYVNLQKWVLSVAEHELTSEIFELGLLQYENVEEDLVRMLQIAIDCTAKDPRSRPSMAEVKSQLEGIVRLSKESRNW